MGNCRWHAGAVVVKGKSLKGMLEALHTFSHIAYLATFED